MNKVHVSIVCLILLLGGCNALRFAPSEEQKQNAYLHHRTLQMSALQAKAEDASTQLQSLTQAAATQSDAIMAYVGMPQELPKADTTEAVLSEANAAITQTAYQQGIQRPDPWQAADSLLELGIAVAGVIGGVYGARAVSVLKTTRQKSQALREIIEGNELFKQTQPDQAEAFKQAQANQSPATKQLVAALKP
ncbi:MAG: hypothetical protein JW709_03705 [Sedimentisphaerales bacterium]|nr:hypothetical protein [Sedimentisphaerales bacterium]